MRFLFRAIGFISLLGLSACTPVEAQPLTLQVFASGLEGSLFITQAPGDSSRFFVLQQSGAIRVIEDGTLLPTPFLSLPGLDAGGETGLLGLAFHPDYATNGEFFVYTTPRVNNQFISRISRFQVSGNPTVANGGSEAVLLEFNQPFNNHNGGMMAFGPNDGYLYIASGDGGSSNDPNGNAQNLNTLLGKLLRISVDEVAGETVDSGGVNYDIPPDNPFIDNQAARPEIWAYGLRNPWRFSFDRQRGDVYIGDVGQGAQEEIDFQPFDSGGGENYGWRVFEGTRCNTPTATQEQCSALDALAIDPIVTHPRAEARSITGGYVYRGGAMPALRGTYFYADFVTARVWSLRRLNGAVAQFTERTAELEAGGEDLVNIASFGEDLAGELYIVSLGGTIWKIVPDAAEGEGEGGPITGQPHSADQDGDFSFDLGELLRVIQFFNAGGYCCASGTPDGFQPAPCGGNGCTPHSSDFVSGGNFSIALQELLRAIQIFNAGSYFPCPEESTPDGFCPAV